LFRLFPSLNPCHYSCVHRCAFPRILCLHGTRKHVLPSHHREFLDDVLQSCRRGFLCGVLSSLATSRYLPQIREQELRPRSRPIALLLPAQIFSMFSFLFITSPCSLPEKQVYLVKRTVIKTGLNNLFFRLILSSTVQIPSVASIFLANQK